MNDPLRILLLEDSPVDAELAERELRRAGISLVLLRVETREDFVRGLIAFQPDIVVADYTLPTFDGLSALGIVREQTPDIPFIILSGSLGDERAVDILKQGANDYVLKDRMQRLPTAILRARQDARDRLERGRIARELQQEKEFITKVIDASPSLVAVLDTDGRIVRGNPAFLRATELANEALSGLPWGLAVPSEPNMDIEALINDTLAGRPAQFEVTLLTLSGARARILWQSSAIQRVNGDRQYLVLTGIDLTEMRRLEAQIEQSRRIDSLGRVAATVAHEFNNVLMMIQSAGAMLRRESANPAAVETAAERIAQAIARGSRITQEVTRFARPAEPALRPIGVNAWVRALVDDLRRMMSEGVTLDLVIPRIDPRVSGDAEQLYQVFSNLLVNARDALTRGGAITLTVDETEEHVRFSVRDTGPGIPPEVLSRIFEPFFTTKRTGTGLGLAVSFQTVAAHGGAISVESSHVGTTFYVLLPRALQ